MFYSYVHALYLSDWTRIHLHMYVRRSIPKVLEISDYKFRALYMNMKVYYSTKEDETVNFLFVP